nr:hypothetical protein [Tanacetum cinerariifolium]
MNDDTPAGVASVVQEGVAPSVVDMTVKMGKPNSLDNTTVLESFPPLSTPLTTTADNAIAKSSYANITSKPSGKKVNVRTLFTPRGNGIDVVVSVDSIRAISKRFANTAYGFFLGKKVAYPVVANYVRNTWGKYGLNNPLILKKWHPDENLLKEDVSTVPVWVKLHGVPVTAFSEDGLSAIATKLGTPLMLDSYTSDMCAGEKKTMKKPSQTPRVVPVGTKIGFKHQKEYQHVTKKPNASSSGNKEKGTKHTIEVSNSNPFDVFNSVDNDGKFGTNEGTNDLINNEPTSSGSSFMYIDNDVECGSNTPIGIPTSGNDVSDKCYGTNTLLEQWRDSYLDNDDYDPYDNDMYENHDLSEHLQSICDDLDLTVRGRKKK